MFSKIMSALKNPVFWAGFAAGAVSAVAFPKLASAVKPVASRIPGSSTAA